MRRLLAPALAAALAAGPGPSWAAVGVKVPELRPASIPRTLSLGQTASLPAVRDPKTSPLAGLGEYAPQASDIAKSEDSGLAKTASETEFLRAARLSRASQTATPFIPAVPRKSGLERAAPRLAVASFTGLPSLAASGLASAPGADWASLYSDAAMLGLLAALGAAAALALAWIWRLLARSIPRRAAPAALASPGKHASRSASIKRALALGLAAVLVFKAAGSLVPDRPSPPRPIGVSATPFRQRDLQVNGMRLRYIDEGQGPPLLLLPGLASRIEELDVLTEPLRADFRVLVFDMPGSGYSDKPDRPYTLEFYEDTALAFLDQMKIRECYVAGGSLGGNLALRLAKRDPERFPRVVAWAPGSSWNARPLVCRFIHAAGGYPIFWPTVRIQSSYWYDPAFPRRDGLLRETFAYYDEVMSPGFMRMYWSLAAQQVGTTLQGLAASVRQPTLLLWGDRDDGGGMAAGVERLSALLPDVRLVVLPGARHSLTAERPRELIGEIVKFLRPEARDPGSATPGPRQTPPKP